MRHLRGVVIWFSLLFITSISNAQDCEYHRVVRVIDGDTFVIDTAERVRLLGVDTPETVDPRRDVEFFGVEASRFLKGLIQGRTVCLRRDRDRTINRDRYGRLLRYVWVDGVFVNREIIKRGYGFVYTGHPYELLEEFRRLQREAREAKRGLWDDSRYRRWAEAYRKNLKMALRCSINGLICPWEAGDHIGKRVRVRMFVRRVVEFDDVVLLNSERDYRARTNLTVVIERRGFNGEYDFYRFWSRCIEVDGKVTLYRDRPEIVVRRADQIGYCR